MSTNPKNNDEEVDLGSLFIIIGKGFSKLFNFIGNIFKGIFHFLILTLLFLKKHAIKISIATVLGIVSGTILELTKEKVYGSDLLLQPNFNSARQLYNNVNYYNDLVKQKNVNILAKTFKITEEDAKSLRKFKIDPIKTENDILSSYNELILFVDTLTVKSYSFDQFKRMYTDFDYRIHSVHVEAIKDDVFSNLDDVIISAIVENQYFDKVKTLTNENLNRTDSLLRQNLAQIDSLRMVYMTVMLEEAKKESVGTNIDLGGNKKTTKELELFETNRTINEDLKDISEDISEKSEVINVISNFQPVGYEVKGIQENYIFLLGTLFAGMMILFILLKRLNKYLENYNK